MINLFYDEINCISIDYTQSQQWNNQTIHKMLRFEYSCYINVYLRSAAWLSIDSEQKKKRKMKENEKCEKKNCLEILGAWRAITLCNTHSESSRYVSCQGERTNRLKSSLSLRDIESRAHQYYLFWRDAVRKAFEKRTE